MTDKTKQEKEAGIRQSELISEALERAKSNGGVWLNPDMKKPPRFYQKGVVISPFNSLTLAIHSDAGNYKTNEYTLFSEAKKRGESVQAHEKGVPFNWYNWNEYVNKHNPEDVISKEDYKALSPEKQELYKGVRSREIRVLFNIDQTTMPFVDKEGYEKEVMAYGSSESRNADETAQHVKVNEFIMNVRDNLVNVYKDGNGMAHYDAKKDIVYVPDHKEFADYRDYVQALVSQVVTATGHQQRLAREAVVSGDGNRPSEDAIRQERLINELATGVKMSELGMSSKLSGESMQMIDYWQRELKENPCLIDVIEGEVNSALSLIHKAERGEKVEKAFGRDNNTSSELGNDQTKHFFVIEELKEHPNKMSKEVVIVRDSASKSADVILPVGASLEVNNEIPGMNKERFTKALQKEGFENIRFYNPDGALGYHFDDSYFEGKDISIAKLNNWSLVEKAKLDVSDAVNKSKSVLFDKVLMLQDDDKRWAMYIKPENGKAVCVYPDKLDTNRFFHAMKQGPEENAEMVRQELAQKYFRMVKDNPDLNVDLFKCKETDLDMKLIERVNIFKTKEQEGKPSKIYCSPTITGVPKPEPREITQQQWFRIWLADDMRDYKNQLAATMFADVLREAQQKKQGDDLHTDKHEQMDSQEAESKEKEEAVETKKEEEEKKQNSPEQKEKEKQEEKAKEEATKAETKAVAAIALSPIVKQFYDLKAKHPDALLLFRCGDFYETYGKDAENASKILGITLTRSSKTKDKDGKPLSMAGFPYHALDTYLPKLIRAGQRVAICDQIEAPKQTVKRGISELLTPGAAVEESSKNQQKTEQERSFSFSR